MFLASLLLLFSFPLAFGASRFPIIAPANWPMQVIRSEADLVVLPVTVTDRKGNFVSGLEQNDFQVYEDGHPQPISFFNHTDIPVTVGLVVDCSGSMLPNRGEVVQAAKDFLTSSNPQDQVFVVNFNEKISLGLPPDVPFTNNVAQLEKAVLNGPRTGLTALYDAIALGLKHLAFGTANRKALVIISDGGDNASIEKFHQVENLAQHNNAIIYAIGILSDIESDVNPGVLRKVAKSTGGEAYSPSSAQELPAISQQIAHDLREMYTIAYVPTNKAHDGTYRKIRVLAHAPGHNGLVIRTRTGYFAPSGKA